MKVTSNSTANSDTVSIRIPLRFAKRGGRKEMQLPKSALRQHRADNTLVKALARAFRWKRLLESGEFATIEELSGREGISPSYMTRILRLALLAPNIVEAISEGTQGTDVTLANLLQGVPVEWSQQIGRRR